MKSILQYLFALDFLFKAQLILCTIFIWMFIKVNISVNTAEAALQKETERNERLKQRLDNITENKKNNTGNQSTVYADSYSPNLKNNSKPKKLLLDSLSSKPSGSSKKSTQQNVPSRALNGVNAGMVQLISYQNDLRKNMIKLNSSESIMLATVRINLLNPWGSYFSAQEILTDENDEVVSKIIHFDCIKAVINIDSSINMEFAEKRDIQLNPIGLPISNKDIKIILTGKVFTSTISCLIKWKDIYGQEFPARFNLLLAR